MALPTSSASAFPVEGSSRGRNCSERSTSLAARSRPTTGCTSAQRFGQSRSVGPPRHAPTAWTPPTGRTTRHLAIWSHHSHASPRGREGGRTGLLIAPLDPQMPQLMRLNDRSHVTSMLKNLTSDSACRAEPTRIKRSATGLANGMCSTSLPRLTVTSCCVHQDRPRRLRGSSSAVRTGGGAAAVRALAQHQSGSAAWLLRRGPGCRMAWHCRHVDVAGGA